MTADDVRILMDDWAVAAETASTPGEWKTAGERYAAAVEAVRLHGPVEWRGRVWSVVLAEKAGHRLVARRAVKGAIR